MSNEADKVFADRRAGSAPPTWPAIASSIGLDTTRVARCIESDSSSALIERDIDAGRRIGLVSTPVMLVNGTLYRGFQPLDTLLARVRQRLAEVAPDFGR